MRFANAVRTAFIVSLILGLSSSASAQAPTSGLLNQRVRLHMQGEPKTRHEGTIQSLSVTSLQLLHSRPGASASQVMIDSVARCQQWVGRKRNTLLGTVIGGAAGLAAGIVVVAIENSSPDPGYATIFDDEEVGTIIVLATMATGALAGTIAGTFIKSDRWQDVPVSNLRLGDAGTNSRVLGFSARVAF